MMMNNLRAVFKLLLFTLWSIPTVAAQCVLLAVHKGRWSYVIPRLWHRGLCRVFEMQVKVTGVPLPPHGQPVMYVGNHTSHFDIMAIGKILEASFVAKNDVAKWPIAGFLAKLQHTAFISRASRDALKEKHSLQSYLKAGRSIILFPEGTTNNGYDLLPFKSSLFSLALEHDLTGGQLRIQPFSLRLHPKHGKTGEQDVRRYPWAFDDHTPMAVHMMRFLGGRGVIIELVFHDAIDPKNYDDRKSLCRAAEKMVMDGHRTGTVQQVPENLPDTAPDTTLTKEPVT